MPEGTCIKSGKHVKNAYYETCGDWAYWNPWFPPDEKSPLFSKVCWSCAHWTCRVYKKRLGEMPRVLPACFKKTKGKLICDCGFKAKNLEAALVHFKTSHNEVVVDDGVGEKVLLPDGMIVCKRCGTCFQTDQDFMSHQNVCQLPKEAKKQPILASILYGVSQLWALKRNECSWF